MTFRAGELLMAGHTRDAQQDSSVGERAPAGQEHEGGHNAKPNTSSDHGKEDKPSNSKETNHCHDSQAASRADEKPKQGPDNLATVQRINGKQVKDQKSDINPPHGADENVGIGRRLVEPCGGGGEIKRRKRGGKNDVDEWAGSNAPEHRSRALWWSNQCYSAEGPEKNCIRLATHLPASHGVTKFMEQYDPEEREVLERVPDRS